MNTSYFISLLLLSLTSAMQTANKFAVAAHPECDTEYKKGGASFTITNDRGKQVGVYSNPGAGQVNYFTVTDQHAYINYGVGHEFFFQNGGELCLKKAPGATHTLCFRAVKVGQFYQLRMAKSTDPLRADQVDQFKIRCASNSKCVIEVNGPLVPYRGNGDDLRPLVFDRDSVDHTRIGLWPSNGLASQLFTLTETN